MTVNYPSLSTVSTSPANTSANAWMYAQLAGTRTPGTIPRGGIKGFKRETGWDEKAGKGTAGATLTRKSKPPVKGSITLQLNTQQDFADWYAFVANVLSVDAAQQEAAGLSFFYPGMPPTGGVTQVVVQDYTLIPEIQHSGLYLVTFALIEWAPPPAASVVATVASSAPDSDDTDAPPVEDPRITSLQAQIAAVHQAAKP